MVSMPNQGSAADARVDPSWTDRAASAFALVGGAFTGAAAVSLAVSAWFYRGFSVAPEEVGIGVSAAGLSFVAVLTMVFVGFQLVIIESMRTGIARTYVVLRQRGRAFALHRLAVLVSLLAFVPAINLTAAREVTLGTLHVDATLLVLLLFVALWSGLGAWNGRFEGSARDQPDDERVRRVRRTVLGISLILFTLMQLVLFVAILHVDESEAKQGRDGSGFLYRATPATVTWLAEPSEAVAATLSHCLVYLGHADGVSVFYDVEARATLRLPTESLVVVVPLDGATPGTSVCS